MKLAIIIEGVQNSGKTSTILHFVNQFQLRTLTVMRSGWQTLFVNTLFQTLKINPYIISSSPSESNNPLTSRFATCSDLPDIIIMAEQTGGRHHSNTTTFLTTNGYIIINYPISNVLGSLDWERFDSSTKSAKLTKRADDIMDSIKLFIKTHSII